MAIAATSRDRTSSALVAAGATAAGIAAVPLLANGMFATVPYGRSWAGTVLRNSAPYIGAFAVPAGLGAGTYELLGGGGAGWLGAAAVGSVLGGVAGATFLHGPIVGGGPPASRLTTAGLVALGGFIMASVGAGLAHTVSSD